MPEENKPLATSLDITKVRLLLHSFEYRQICKLKQNPYETLVFIRNNCVLSIKVCDHNREDCIDAIRFSGLLRAQIEQIQELYPKSLIDNPSSLTPTSNGVENIHVLIFDLDPRQGWNELGEVVHFFSLLNFLPVDNRVICCDGMPITELLRTLRERDNQNLQRAANNPEKMEKSCN